MRKLSVIIIGCLLISACRTGNADLPSSNPVTMEIKSTAFENEAQIPAAFTCDGQDLRPPFSVSGVPKGTKSLAIMFHDPDAPVGDWLHWSAWDLTPDTGSIVSESLPDRAVEGLTSSGITGYRGPCPPSGTHHYIFDLYALDTTLNLPSGTDRKTLETALGGHVLATARLTGLYRRKI